MARSKLMLVVYQLPFRVMQDLEDDGLSENKASAAYDAMADGVTDILNKHGQHEAHLGVSYTDEYGTTWEGVRVVTKAELSKILSDLRKLRGSKDVRGNLEITVFPDHNVGTEHPKPLEEFEL